jgi:parallel beta-helix repeat protein
MPLRVSVVLLLILLTTSVPTLAVRPVFAQTLPIITISADGSIDPLTAPIEQVHPDLYILTGDIVSMADGIIIERNNIVLDGQGHTIQGASGTFAVGILLSNRTEVTLRNLRVIGYYYGLEVDSCTRIEIGGNIIEGNGGDGIFLDETSFTNITRNAVVSNLADGVFLYSYSNHNEISKNLVKNNNYRGIDLFSGCFNNTISENSVVSNNMTGIYLSASSNNTIYHNNIIDNRVQAEAHWAQNTWDNGYPSGGNYWSDYSGTDVKKAPNQDAPGSDSIGDAPRLIDANNSDTYPLIALWGSIDGDINSDRAVDIYDAILLSNAFNSTPSVPNWNPKADFNKNGIIDIFDAIVLAANYGKIL